MSDNIISNVGDNVNDLFSILCHVIPHCGSLSKHITAFLEKHKYGCKTASSCVQTIVGMSGQTYGDGSFKIENYGVMFVCDESVVFVGSRPSQTDSLQYETIHDLNDVTNIITTKKSIVITKGKQVFTYKFKEFDNNVVDCIIQLYEMKSSWVRVRNNFHNPSRLNVVMLSIGSRGDVQPFISLATGLMKKHYNVRIVTHSCFENLVKSNGIDFYPLSCDPKELMKLCVNNSMFSISFIKEGKKIFLDKIDNLLTESWNGCKDANILISTPTSIAGYHIAEKLQIPFFNAFTMPITDHGGQNILTLTTSDYTQNWYTMYTNSVVDFLADKTMWLAYGDKVNQWRMTTLELPPKKFYESNKFIFDNQKIITLYCYSEHIFPKPFEWTSNIHVTGYWKSNIEENYTPSEELSLFLREVSKPPLFISFGSIPIPNPNEFYNIFIKICEEREIPLIIGRGWSTTNIKSSKTVFVTDEVPYDYLLPHVKLMVHHGGAGTTSACAHNKIPMLIIPFFGDQFFWGKRVQDLGIGCAISYKDVNEYNISEILDLLESNEDYKKNVGEIGDKLENESGVQCAINIIEQKMLLAYIPPSGKPDSGYAFCSNKLCGAVFTIMQRKHHCRNCGGCFCDTCTRQSIPIAKYRFDSVKVCEICFKDLIDLR
jgi:UDP:flavonoid glycosyltransferase YjiC (YdhE family)/CheY-specific phosphatase CheX